VKNPKNKNQIISIRPEFADEVIEDAIVKSGFMEKSMC